MNHIDICANSYIDTISIVVNIASKNICIYYRDLCHLICSLRRLECLPCHSPDRHIL